MADAPTSGTVADSSGANIVANAIANAGNPQPAIPLGDQSDAIYDSKVKEGDEPTQPKKDDETQEPVPAPEESQDDEQEPEGYFADEGIDDEPDKTPSAPKATDTTGYQQLTPEEQFIAQNIGQPVNVRIKVGDKVQSVQAYAPENLPEDFEYASERDRTQALLAFDRLARKAEQLQSDYQNQQQQEQAKSYSEQEDADIQRDIAALQRRKQGGGDGLDLFKYAPNDERFENDPAVKEMQEILNFYNDENKARWEQSQRTGRQFRPLTYKDAFVMHRAENPKVGKAQQEEDEQRKKITRPLAKAGKSSGEDLKAQQRPKLPRNANIDQIIAAYRL